MGRETSVGFSRVPTLALMAWHLHCTVGDSVLASFAELGPSRQ